MDKSELEKMGMSLTLKAIAFGSIIVIVGGAFASTVYFGSIYFGRFPPINKELEEYSGPVSDFINRTEP